MSCDQIHFVSRLAVEEPTALAKDPWKAHLEKCSHCRMETVSLNRSLALFRRMEGLETLPERAEAGWERFAGSLGKRQTPRWRFFSPRLPLAAAAGVILVVMAGSIFWNTRIPQEVLSPHAVTLKPDERLHLQRVLRRSIESSVLSKSASHSTPARSTPRQRVLPGSDRIFVNSPALSPNDRPVAGGSPVVLFRSLRQLRTQEGPERTLSRPSVTVQPVGNPVSPAGLSWSNR